MNLINNISIELQDAIIGSLIMKPTLTYELNGLGGFIFSEDRKKAFELTVEQINETQKIDIPLLGQQLTNANINIDLTKIIKHTDPRNFTSYVSQAIEAFKKIQESSLVTEFSTDLVEMNTADAVQKHEKGRGLLNELFTTGLTDRSADLNDAREGITNHVEPTQYKAINDLIRGFMIGGYDIFPARPSMGKTTLMIDFALGLSQKNIPVCLLSLEMSKKLIYAIIACRLSGVRIATIYKSKEMINAMDAHDKELHQSEMERYYVAYEELAELPLYVFDVSDTTNKIGGVTNFIRVAQKKHGINYFFIDYLQKMQSSEKTNSRNYEIEDISGALSRLPLQINCYIGAFSQLSRAVETRGGSKRPIMSDLRDGGAIEQDAFNIYFLYRPEYYGIKEDDQGNSVIGLLELIVAKGRIFGGIGTCEIWYNKAKQGYVNDKHEEFEREPQGLPNGGIIEKAGVMSDDDVPF